MDQSGSEQIQASIASGDRADSLDKKFAGLPKVGVVLAAGRSRRLHDVTGGGSKALVHLGGLTLVERAVRTLLSAGVETVLVVVGHHAGTVAAVTGRMAPGRVRAIHAENWEKGNGASLAAVRSALAGEEIFALLTADHVFTDGALEELLHAEGPAVLIDTDPDREALSEGTKVRVAADLATGFGKQLQEDSIDCGAFLLPNEVFEYQRQAAARDDWSLAGAITRLARSLPLRAIRIPKDYWWQDIDSPADLRTARRRLRQSLTRPSDGPISRFINRPLSTRLSMVLAPLSPSPDLLSVIAFAVALIAGAFLLRGNGLVGGLLAQVASILDGVDGEVARLRVRSSPRGALLDGVLDRVADSAIIAGLGVWTIDLNANPRLSIVLTVAAATAAILSMATKDRVAALGLPKASERRLGYLLGGRDARVFLLAVGALLGRPDLALSAVTLTGGVSVALRVWLVRRHAREASHHSSPVLMSYRAVIFDIGGVIVPSPFDAWASYERELGLPVGFIRRVVAAGGDTGAWARLERNEIAMEDFVGTFEAECEAAGGKVSAREVLARVGLGAGEPRPEMINAVRKIRAHGLRTAALTNNWARDTGAAQNPDERSNLIGSLFDVIVESSVTGLRKPDPRIYLLTCERLGVEPEEVIFLDDLGMNLKPARELGMKTIKVAEPAEALDELESLLGFAL